MLILLVLGISLLSACGEHKVVSADNEAEAIRMYDILYSNGFKVEKREQTGEAKGWDIYVDEGWFGSNEAATAIQVLNDYGLPRLVDSKPKETGGFGMPTALEEKERQVRELQIQIENQLYNLPNVIRAKVIISQPINDRLSLEKTPPTASAVLTIKDSESNITTETVQSIVAAAVPDLKPGNVQVTLSKQALREVPRTALDDQRRSNAIFTIGGIVLFLLVSALGIVWYVTKRRKQKLEREPELLTDEESTDELLEADHLALNGENEE